ncbi:MAG: DNA mismatch repair endonuclease MutL [Planctomycetaceae bacterium]|nr:DNA mismatch repair endonuclease MutL [Planctomycetaceae bacterium]
MGKIQALPVSVINRIAAGEVVERPASVVKELLENALDSDPTRIDAELEQGGVALIRIVDDGCGIETEELPLAVSPHATSKLRSADDLEKIETLGFRGEALASISEVSRVVIRTRTALGTGSRLEVDSGLNRGVQPEGCGLGTSIEVHQLFSKIPARRAFLKTPATEWSHASEAFVKTALAHPEVAFSLTHNRRRVHDLPVVGDWRQRIADIYGSQLASRLLCAKEVDDDISVMALLGRPEDDMASGRFQHFFISGRPFRDRSIMHAVQEGYRGRLLSGRQPIVFLQLQVPLQYVDVNVHPAKTEVRFRDPGRLHRLVLLAVRRAIAGVDGPTAFEPPRSVSPASAGLAAAEDIWKRQQSYSEGEEGSRGEPRHEVSGREESGRSFGLSGRNASGTGEDSVATQESFPGVTENKLPEERAVQMHQRYLVVETEGGIEVIDQHALHERVLYEQLRTRISNGVIEVQSLLIPEQVELTSSEFEVVTNHLDVLSDSGVKVESFGGNTVVVRGKPALVGRTPASEIIQEVVDRLTALAANGGDHQAVVDEVLHSLSCRAAIKAGDALSQVEVDTLVADRHRYQGTGHCPHGRPTSLVLSRQELDKQFRRT